MFFGELFLSTHNLEQESMTLLFTFFVAVIAALIGAGYSIWKTQKDRENEIKKTTKKTLETESRDLKQIYSEITGFESISTGETWFYINKQFSTITYEAIINSGSFMYLKSDMQSILNEVYFRVRQYNMIFHKFEDLVAKAATENLRKEGKVLIMENYIQELASILDELFDDIEDQPSLVKKFEDKIKLI